MKSINTWITEVPGLDKKSLFERRTEVLGRFSTEIFDHQTIFFTDAYCYYKAAAGLASNISADIAKFLGSVTEETYEDQICEFAHYLADHLAEAINYVCLLQDTMPDEMGNMVGDAAMITKYAQINEDVNQYLIESRDMIIKWMKTMGYDGFEELLNAKLTRFRDEVEKSDAQ